MVYNTATASVSLTVNQAAQTGVTVTPASTSVQAGSTVAFTAANGLNGYAWGGAASGTGGSTNVTFPNVGSYSVTVYSPSGGNYQQSNTATSAVTVTAIPATFTVSPTSLTYTGSAHGPTISPSPSGATWSVTSGTATATAAGNYSLTATASGNYSGTSGAVNWSIAKAAPTISWATPSAITYGAALSAAQLDATASAPGTFAYSPASGAVLGAGSQTLSVTFTPTDTSDYTTATASVSLTVNQAPPPTVSITPSSTTITVGQSVTFTASGGLNGYSWGGSASGTGSSQTVTFQNQGTFTVTATSPAGGNYAQSNTAAATVTVNYPYVNPDLEVLSPTQ